MVYSSDLVLELISTRIYILSNLVRVCIPAFLLLFQLYQIRLKARKASFTSRIKVSNSNTPFSSNDIVWLLFLDLSYGLSKKLQSLTRVHLWYVYNDIASSLHNKHLATRLFGAYTFKINISPFGRPANLTHYAQPVLERPFDLTMYCMLGETHIHIPPLPAPKPSGKLLYLFSASSTKKVAPPPYFILKN